MKGREVEVQQLGTSRTETIAHPGECRHFGHATKLHSSKVTTFTRIPGSGGPSL